MSASQNSSVAASSLTAREVDSRVQNMIKECKAQGLRRTKALEELIRALITEARPMTLGELAQSKFLAPQCNKATVFRLLQKLIQKKIARRLGFHERAAYFALQVPGAANDYLICTGCGTIEPIIVPEPLHEFQMAIGKKRGFRSLYRELELFGLCPNCH